MLTVKSYAKLNLVLEVLGKRADGYHELSSVFQTISLHDLLCFSGRRDGRIVLSCDDPSLPVDETNLVIKAAQLLRARLQARPSPHQRALGATIKLRKRIPVGAGLGGGSSNAAVTLKTLLKLWNVKGFAHNDLSALAAEIGSDVPYFLSGGTCLVTGRGELVKPVRPLPKLHIVLIFPQIAVATAWAYRQLKFALTKQPQYSTILAFRGRARANILGIARLLYNDFEKAVIPHQPPIARARQDLVGSGALGALMSGSGSSVFGLYKDRESAHRAWRQLEPGWPASFLVESIGTL